MDVAVENVFLLVLYKCTGRGMHNAFGGAGRAGRVENIEWM